MIKDYCIILRGDGDLDCSGGTSNGVKWVDSSCNLEIKVRTWRWIVCGGMMRERKVRLK